MEDVSGDEYFSIDQILQEEHLLQQDFMAEHEGNFEHQVNRKQLNLYRKRAIVDHILSMLVGDSLPHGAQTTIANHFHVHKSTISRIYQDIIKQKQRGELIDVRSKKLGKCGPKPKEYSEQWLQSVPLRLRTTERSYAGALKISHVTVHRLKKRGLLRTHTSNNHPTLTDNHKVARVQWVLSHLTPATPTSNPTFVDMSNIIHIDEKWFYLNPETRRFFLLPKEDDPYRCQQSKRFKVKGMFMGMISPPLHDNNGLMIHDGKYGIFPFVFKQAAKKSSKNRVAGTLETKALQHINQEVIRDMLLNKVIPAIIQHWPAHMDKEIVIQWDNARPHKIPLDEEFVAATKQQGFNIKIVYQPPQSPDLNVLDLGLFRAIQSIQYQSFPTNLDELIKEVEDAYKSFDPTVNKYSWLTLQSCMVEILKNQGGNNYRTPHMGKRRLDSEGELPERLEVSPEIVAQAVNFLNDRFRPTNQQQQDNDTQVEVDAD